MYKFVQLSLHFKLYITVHIIKRKYKKNNIKISYDETEEKIEKKTLN